MHREKGGRVRGPFTESFDELSQGADECRRNSADDAVQHPGATEVEPVEVRELPIGAVGALDRREPARKGRSLGIGKQCRESVRERLAWQYAPQEIRLAQQRREEIVP